MFENLLAAICSSNLWKVKKMSLSCCFGAIGETRQKVQIMVLGVKFPSLFPCGSIRMKGHLMLFGLSFIVHIYFNLSELQLGKNWVFVV